MSFRFRKSVKLMPGVRLNLSRSGVSTTFGVRGASVNVGRRGTFLNTGIPGTGIHHRSRIGGGRSGAGAAGGAAAAGCAGCGIIPLMFLVLVGMCSAIIGGSGGSHTPSISTFDTASTAPSADRQTLYAHGAMNIRSGASTSYAVVRTLTRGESIEVGIDDRSGWAPAYESYGSRIGYIYRASNNLRAYAPATRTYREPRRERRTRPSNATAICRDGTYSYSAHRRGTCSHHGGVSMWL